jgi:Family of unknown function (DUF5677)
MDTSSIEKKYNDHDFLYRDLKQAFEKANIKIHFPISHQVISDLSKRITYIFNGIINAAKDDNLYSAFILYRSLLEHFFKGEFIIDKMVTTMSDEPAENYQKHYLISEFLAEQAGVLEMEDLLNDNQVKTDFIKFVTTKMSDLQDFDKANQQEISAAIRQFNLKEIVKHLHARYKLVDSLQATNHIIAQTLPEYSYVSTFTHGGSYASVLMDKFIRQNDVENQLIKIMRISLTSTCVTKENIFMSYEIDESFKDYIFKLQSLRAL